MMMVTYASFIYFFLLPSSFAFENAWKIMAWIAASTILLPAVMVFFFRVSGLISSWRMEEQKERNWPLLSGALIYLASFYVVHDTGFPFFVRLFLLGAILGILISLLINLRWKISLHMIGIGGLCGGMTMLMLLQENGSPVILFTIFICAGMLGTARLFLNAHSPQQVFAGFITGFTTQFLLVFLSGR
jgi:hypothetical protein